MAVDQAFSAYGLDIAIELPNRMILRRLLPLLPPGAQLAEAATGTTYHRRYAVRPNGEGYRLYRDGRPLLPDGSVDFLLDRLERDLGRFLAERASGHMFVHAGVVAIGGKALLVPGRSQSGKSTLVTALVRAGATYYSDEYALIDAKGRVHAYARPLVLRTDSGRKRVPPHRLVRRSTRGHGHTTHLESVLLPPLPVGWILLCPYRPSHAKKTARSGAEKTAAPPWRLQPLGPGRVMLALLKHTVAARSRAEEALATFSKVAQSARGFYGWRGEAAQFAHSLLEEMFF